MQAPLAEHNWQADIARGQVAITRGQAIIAAITAIAAVGAVIFSALTVNASQEGQYTERFNKAIEQLDKSGSDHLQARLGGIYALERLGKDSARDQPVIIEVLSAFIRSTTPTRSADWPSTAAKCPDKPVATDVQAALTVLGRRDVRNDKDVYPDLSGACLRQANLQDAYLAGANLSKADLGGSNLSGAWLTAAKLRQTGFESQNAPYTSLYKANMIEADLSGAKFGGAYLGGADLTETKRDGDTSVDGAITTHETKGKWW
ncbi:pentapeptide repeat-containing protein [Lentzea sp. NPDC042327]|uniref:pentapeptide repeat-containing protein n=1 Tax=Lentzea sp. NPDC042327 TaxID=3154801 RepID=UPI0033E0A158